MPAAAIAAAIARVGVGVGVRVRGGGGHLRLPRGIRRRNRARGRLAPGGSPGRACPVRPSSGAGSPG